MSLAVGHRLFERLHNYIKREFRPEVIQFARYIPRGRVYLRYLDWMQVEALSAAEWVGSDRQTTCLVDYELNENSLVFDVGGFKGGFTERIWRRYACNVFVFEPVPAFAEDIRRKFAGNAKIHIYDFGLGGTTRRTQLGVDDDASSIFRQGSQIEIQLVEALQLLRDLEIPSSRFPHVDLMEVNIEGGEYELLGHLIEGSWVKNIRNLLVQFHNIIPEAGRLMLGLQKELRRTHYLTYQYPFCWENWRLKGL